LNKLKTGLTITLVVTILLTIYLSIATITNMKTVQGYNSLGWGYLYVYFLLPLTIILFLILTANYIFKSGIKGLKELRWNFILLTIFIIMLSLTGQLNKFYGFKNKLILSVGNKMKEPIDILRIYGRHDLIEIKDLKQGDRKYIEFRGKNIDYKTKNYLENRIYVDYYSSKEWSSELIVGPWTVLIDTLKIDLIKKDSIQTN